jgi:hypothetical protein
MGETRDDWAYSGGLLVRQSLGREKRMDHVRYLRSILGKWVVAIGRR